MGAHKSLPFYLSQPVDEVLKVARITKRQRRKIEFTDDKGTLILEDGKPAAGWMYIDISQDLTVKYFYPDCVLTFQRTYDDEGGGALCYRVTAIEETDVPG